MKAQDIFRTPTIHLTPYQSVDVSKFLHADAMTGIHTWTFISNGTDGEWTSTKHGTIREAMKGAIKDYCLFYHTKFARLTLISME
jgi:hypothetical protein